MQVRVFKAGNHNLTIGSVWTLAGSVTEAIAAGTARVTNEDGSTAHVPVSCVEVRPADWFAFNG